MNNKTSIEEDIKIANAIVKVNKDYLKDVENQTINQREIQAIKNILADRERLKKEKEELKEERELVGLPVINTRSGQIGIILHKWKSGSIAVLESISPRIINTHDSWKTLEIITDNVEQIKTKFDNLQTLAKANAYDSLTENIKDMLKKKKKK